jgi:hypothetical protein
MAEFFRDTAMPSTTTEGIELVNSKAARIKILPFAQGGCGSDAVSDMPNVPTSELCPLYRFTAHHRRHSLRTIVTTRVE